MGWEAVADEIVLSQASSDDLIARLNDEANPALEEELDSNPPIWWLQMLRKHAASLGLSIPEWKGPNLSCVSACSGSLAECAVFKDSALLCLLWFSRILGILGRAFAHTAFALALAALVLAAQAIAA